MARELGGGRRPPFETSPQETVARAKPALGEDPAPEGERSAALGPSTGSLGYLPRLRRIVADVFGLDPQSVTGATSVDNVQGWDSLQHLNLIIALEAEFRVSFTPEEIAELTSVEIIALTLKERGVEM
jgi:acyl carrier protein